MDTSTPNDEHYFENRIDLTALNEAIMQIRNEISKIIVGQKTFIDLLITAVLADGHVLIEGVPGVAKTLTAKLLARTISTNFSRIQFTPDLMPSDVLGTSIYNFKNSEFEFKAGPIFSNLILIDEINRSPAKTQAALFEVMEERQITLDATVFKMQAPFLVLATQNPIEQEGTYRLPEAQLDRFLFKIEVGYPSLEEEVEIIKGFHKSKNQHQIDKVLAVLSSEQLAHYREQVRGIHIDDKLMVYIAQIVQQTRHSKDLYLGASPRASLAILATAKAFAAMQARDFVTPEDIIYMTKPVMRHRIMLSPEKEMEGSTTDAVIDEIVRGVEVPR
ncbi:MAG: AAA family ATPase [Chitinophagales bacterium]